MKFNTLTCMMLILGMGISSCQSEVHQNKIKTEIMKENSEFKVNRTEEEWKEKLSEEEYYVLREAGTERPYSGKFNMHFEDGIYSCKACGEALFESDSKFDAHCGWPSFDRAIEGKIIEKIDTSHGMIRTETLCANCGSHLGHVFEDGPTETGLRYCMNSISLDFEEEE